MTSARLVLLTLSLATLAGPLAAQGTKPTGLCGDGTTTSAATATGACSGHGGVKTWYGKSGPPATPAPKATPVPKPDAPRTVSKIPEGMTGLCGDGSYTSATTKVGACSSHGGVKQWYGVPKPAGATALCKDGTYSVSKTRSGTCSAQGGVKEWLKKGQATT